MMTVNTRPVAFMLSIALMATTWIATVTVPAIPARAAEPVPATQIVVAAPTPVLM